MQRGNTQGSDLDGPALEAIEKLQLEQQQRLKAELETARLKAALEQSQSQAERQSQSLLQSEKMASLGLLSAGIAHEINNPVGYIISNVATLGDYLEDITQAVKLLGDIASPAAQGEALQALRDQANQLLEQQDIQFVLEDIDGLIDETRQGAERVLGIVAGLKNYAGKNTDAKAFADVNECLEATLALVANELKYHCEVEVQLGSLPPTRFSEGKLGQVFLNLMVNAGQAVGERGHIRVASTLEDAQIVVEITDDGMGMTPQVMQKIFEPFYTTKPKGQGTGLGLSISKGIVEEHGGTLEVRSTPGEGTTFSLKLPVCQPPGP